MTDPLRWTDDGAESSSLERELLSAGQGMGPSSAEKQQAWAGILLQTAAAAAAATAAVKAGGTMTAAAKGSSAAAGQSIVPGAAHGAAWSLGSKVIGIAALLGVLGGGYWATLNDKAPLDQLPSEASPALSPVRQRVFVDVAKDAKSLPREAAASAAAPDERDPAADDTLPAQANGREISSEPLPSSAEKPLSEQQKRASRLREESLAVLEVRRILRGGNSPRALSLLQQARDDFPDGALGQEREALTIEALVGSGARAEAAVRAQSFLKSYPKSPFAADVKKFATP